MSDVAEKVKKIIVDQLGVSADEVKPRSPALWKTWALTPWT